MVRLLRRSKDAPPWPREACTWDSISPAASFAPALAMRNPHHSIAETNGLRSDTNAPLQRRGEEDGISSTHVNANFSQKPSGIVLGPRVMHHGTKSKAMCHMDRSARSSIVAPSRANLPHAGSRGPGLTHDHASDTPSQGLAKSCFNEWFERCRIQGVPVRVALPWQTNDRRSTTNRCNSLRQRSERYSGTNTSP